MSLNFAGISPHPPIIISGIGTPEDLEKTGSTILGMKKLATAFVNAEIDTLVIISPHSLVYPDKFNICGMKKLFGTFASFDHPDLIVESQNDLDFVATLQNATNNAGINSVTFDNDGEFFELDHGLMVPMYYLSKNQEYSFRVVPVAFSGLPRANHFAFGQALLDACKKSTNRIGILASGDLSHRLLQNPIGKKFDETLCNDLKNGNARDILYYDEELVEGAGECGYRSILILLGAVSDINAKAEILSYEGPFGVGYLVANYKLPEA
jgi:MEMO1 family protein